MTSPFSSSLLLSLLVAAVSPAQQQPGPASEQLTKPVSIVYKWRWLEKQKQVTHQFPTDYQVGGVYRLKQDVVVECDGTDSRVSQYWVDIYSPGGVEGVKQLLRDPQTAKEREIQALQQVAADNPRLAIGVDMEIRGIRRRRETQSILSEGTMLRFHQIWLQRSFEMGVSVHPYVEILDGPLQGKWVDISSLSECETNENAHCNPKPEYIEYVAK